MYISYSSSLKQQTVIPFPFPVILFVPYYSSYSLYIYTVYIYILYIPYYYHFIGYWLLAPSFVSVEKLVASPLCPSNHPPPENINMYSKKYPALWVLLFYHTRNIKSDNVADSTAASLSYSFLSTAKVIDVLP